MPKLLLLFQNAYTYHGGRMRSPTYGVSWIYRKNATYSRVVPFLEPHFELRFAECTPRMARDRRTKFPTDLEWVRRAVDQSDWYSIVSFGRQAHEALEALEVDHWDLPHPVSHQWRRSYIEWLAGMLVGDRPAENSEIVTA